MFRDIIRYTVSGITNNHSLLKFPRVMPPSAIGDQILSIVPENRRLSPRLTGAMSIAFEELATSV